MLRIVFISLSLSPSLCLSSHKQVVYLLAVLGESDTNPPVGTTSTEGLELEEGGGREGGCNIGPVGPME